MGGGGRSHRWEPTHGVHCSINPAQGVDFPESGPVAPWNGEEATGCSKPQLRFTAFVKCVLSCEMHFNNSREKSSPYSILNPTHFTTKGSSHI